MKRALLLAAGMAAFLSACLNWDTGIACRTALHCPDGMYCGSDGTCHDGTPPPDGGTPDAGRRDGG
ncbi:MAG: hypothetical protein HY904_21015 [Deltaproteobacteria bacterium]|nr:hypothetical protein [Deltaproteobacteria bacterium]